MLVRQPFAAPGLTLHVHPVSGRQIGFGPRAWGRGC